MKTYYNAAFNNEDILHQAFDRHEILHQPQRIGTVDEVRGQAAAYNEYVYESAPLEYAQLFDPIPLN